MKQRTKAQMAQYQKDRRTRLKAQDVTPAADVTPDVTPKKCNTRHVTPGKRPQDAPAKVADAPAAPAEVPASCPECARLRAELKKEREESARLRAMLKKFLNKPEEAQDAPEDPKTLAARVIAAKIKRLSGHHAPPSGVLAQ